MVSGREKVGKILMQGCSRGVSSLEKNYKTSVANPITLYNGAGHVVVLISCLFLKKFYGKQIELSKKIKGSQSFGTISLKTSQKFNILGSWKEVHPVLYSTC